MSTLQLRDYQHDALAANAKAWESGILRPANVLATGLGKTVIFTEEARRTVRDRRERVAVMVHRDELAGQAEDKLRDADPDLTIGVVKAARNELGRDVTILSQQTIARQRRLEMIPKDCFGLVIVDECHHAAAASYLNALTYFGCYENTRALGVTATMGRGDGKALSRVWQEIVIERDVLYGIANGYLVDVRGKRIEIEELDLAGVARSKGDYQDGALGNALEEAGASEALVKAYHEHAPGRQGIIFAPTVETAMLFGDAMNAAGVPTGVIIGTTTKEERKEIYRAYRARELTLISSCMVLTEGFDMPQAEVAYMLRPTQNAPLYIQMAGRVLRPYPGKREALILDFVGASSIGLRSVSDLGTVRVKDGESLGEAAKRGELDPPPWDIEPGSLGPHTIEWKDVDLFAASRSVWLRTPGGTWFIPTHKALVFLRELDEPGRYQIGRTHNQYELKARWGRSEHGYLMEGKDFSESFALAWGEQLAAELEDGPGFRVGSRDSSWRKLKAPMTDGQREQLGRLGIVPEPGTGKNEASNLISIAFAKQMLDP